MSAIEALYIFDEHNTLLLSHSYTARPPPASVLLPLYLSHPAPQPSLIYLPSTSPPTLLYSILHSNLLFLAPTSLDTEPLQTLEFLHRVADALEDFLGAPLLASKIEAHYDTVAQLLGEMVDAGIINGTESNALREVVEVPSALKSLLGGVGLPSSTPSAGQGGSGSPFSLGRGSSGMVGMGSSGRSSPGGFNHGGGAGGTGGGAGPTVYWRKQNVRHTSNELYVDMVESLSVILSPSGRPLSAMANGTIAFTAKVSGVPELNMLLSAPGGIANTISLPAFHPCVRLKRWHERPGELSFVPPDGRFVLGGYEVDLLGGDAILDGFTMSSKGTNTGTKLNIPATAIILSSLGPQGADFEVRVLLNPRYAGSSTSTGHASSAASRSGSGNTGLGGGLNLANLGNLGGGSQGTSTAPVIEEIVVHVPLPPAVKNIADLRTSRGAGEAAYAPGDRRIEWRLSSREVNFLLSQDRGAGQGVLATLSGTVIGQDDGDDAEGISLSASPHPSSDPYSYHEYDEGGGAEESRSCQSPEPMDEKRREERDAKRVKQNKVLMPSSATVSFSVKGWLPSGIKVESLSVDQKRSKGLGAGVTPYKGVKYLCVSKEGVECRG